MSDKSAQLMKQLGRNADKITLGVLAVILAGLAFTWWQEQSTTVGRDAATGRPATLTDELAESPALRMLSGMSANPLLENAPEIQRLAQLNMFDFSTADAERNMESQAIAQLEQAKQLITQGQTDQAREALLPLKGALQWYPDYRATLDSVTSKPEELGADPNMMGDGMMPGEEPQPM